MEHVETFVTAFVAALIVGACYLVAKHRRR